MTLMRLKIYPFALSGCLILMLCGFGPDLSLKDSLDEAQRNLESARTAGVATYAPLELRFADERMQQAQLAFAAKDKGALQRITEEVMVTVELAMAKTRLAKAREQVEEKSRENAQLNKDVSNGHEGRAP